MFSTRGEGQPAKPQEGQEFNKEKSNSKARTGASEQETDHAGVGQDGAPDRRPSECDASRTRPPGRQEHARGDRDQRPVSDLEAPKARI
jgi:hypothetical protein